MNKLRAAIREFIKKELEELSTSAAAGPYNTPNAFASGTRKGDEDQKKTALMAAGHTLSESVHPIISLIRIIKEEQESAASQEAKKHGLVAKPFGRYADPNTGKVVARSVGGNLEWLNGKQPSATPEQPAQPEKPATPTPPESPKAAETPAKQKNAPEKPANAEKVAKKPASKAAKPKKSAKPSGDSSIFVADQDANTVLASSIEQAAGQSGGNPVSVSLKAADGKGTVSGFSIVPNKTPRGKRIASTFVDDADANKLLASVIGQAAQKGDVAVTYHEAAKNQAGGFRVMTFEKAPETPPSKAVSSMVLDPAAASAEKALNVTAYRLSPKFNVRTLKAFMKKAKPGTRAEDRVVITDLESPEQIQAKISELTGPWLASGWAAEAYRDPELNWERGGGSQHSAGATPYQTGKKGDYVSGGAYRIFLYKH